MTGSQVAPLALDASQEDVIHAINRILAVFGGDIDQNLAIKAGNKVVGDIMGFIRADKDSDGDYDALTAAAWENSTKSGSGTINWANVFGVPSAAVAVVVYTHLACVTAGERFEMKAKSGASNFSFRTTVQVSNKEEYAQGIIPIAANGTSYYNFTIGMNTFYLRVIGWFR